MNKGFNKGKIIKNDDYSTRKTAYELIKEYIPTKSVLYDPFYYNGVCKTYMEEVFPTCKIIHEDKNAYEWNPEHDIVISNPPFSEKYDVLDWLIKKDKPFALLLPLCSLCTIKFSEINNIDKLQFVIGKKRIRYERVGQKQGSANFESAWYCYKMDLPKSIIFK
jgi:hypothetical protein